MARQRKPKRRCEPKRQTYAGSLRDATAKLLPRDVLPLLPTDGRTRWTGMLLALCAILMAWGGDGTLKDRFDSARRCLRRWYPGRRRPGACYEGFVAALRRRGAWMARQVGRGFRGHVRRLAEARGRWAADGWVAFGVDSTKHDAPMTAANEGRLGVASKAGSWPQLLLTTFVHLGTNLPWSFAQGRATSSERRHALGLLCTLPRMAMILADAGFVGYAFWRRIAGSGRSFLVRVGGNVRLIESPDLIVRFHDGVVWIWPADQQRRRQPPLILRLITLTDERNRTMYLLTDVLECDRLSDAAAARLYRLRWGVELAYRSLKQTLGRRKLLSDAPRNARMELTWAVIGLWALLLIKAERCASSFAGAQGIAAVLRVFRRAMAGVASRGGGGLSAALSKLRPDAYERAGPKRARHWPHRKRPKPPGRPKARNATEAELALAKELEPLQPAA